MKTEEIIAFYKKLDRSHFIDNEFKDMAAIDRPLPIGFGADDFPAQFSIGNDAAA